MIAILGAQVDMYMGAKMRMKDLPPFYLEVFFFSNIFKDKH